MADPDPLEALPVRPPILPMLAEADAEIPTGPEWIYEPKWDGFRGVIFKSGNWVHIGSRNTKPLQRFFPELIELCQKTLPDRCVIDGEILIFDAKRRLSFASLQMRLHPAPSRIKKLSGEIPAEFAAFDLLALDGDDLRERPFAERRALLEKVIAAKPDARLSITPQTRDPKRAREWVEGNAEDGLDGVVAKKESQKYVSGKREMVKIKPHRTADCVVGGFRMHKDGKGLGSLILGLYGSDGVLHHVGHTAAFTAKQRREFLEKLTPHIGQPSFGGENLPGGPSRWKPGGEESPITTVAPVFVVEVGFDRMMAWGEGEGGAFRHATTFKRWREDKDPKQCGFDQFGKDRG